jgi:hypothetical protein
MREEASAVSLTLQGPAANLAVALGWAAAQDQGGKARHVGPNGRGSA